MRGTWLLLKVIHNILVHPDEAKYRKLRTSSETVTQLLALPGVTELLLHLGFTREATHFVLPSPDLCALAAAVDALTALRRRFHTLEAFEIFQVRDRPLAVRAAARCAPR